MVATTHLFILGSNMIRFQKTIIFIFSLWLLSGLVGVIVGFNEKDFAKRELREPVQLKDFDEYKDSKDFLFNTERYFDDRIFLRGAYISLYNIMGFNWLTASFKSNSSFFLGKDDWIFIGNSHANAVDYTINAVPPTELAINKSLDRLKAVKNIAEEYNIPYVIMIAPNKQSIYFEYFPRWLRYKSDYRFGDIIYDKAKEHNINIVFPKYSILQEKQNATKAGRRLYWKDDTHWNNYGALIAFRELWAVLMTQGDFPNLPDLISLKEIKNKNKGDLLNISKLPSTFSDPVSYAYRIDSNDKENIQRKKHLLTIDDSFSYTIMPLYTLGFDKVTRLHWDQVDLPKLKELVERIKPDAIIYEIVEQKIETDGI